MLLAGDIGGTKTALAIYAPDKGPHAPLAEETFPSARYRSGAIELSWCLIDPVLEAWENDTAPPLASYERGSWGPAEAEALLAHDGHAWLRSCGNHHKAISGNSNE